MKTEEINLPHVVAEVTAVFYCYEHALISNAIDTLDALFWHDKRAVRLGIYENLYGIEAIRNFRTQRPSIGLVRKLHNSIVTTFGEEYAVCSTEFTNESTKKLGRQQQTWVKLSDGWRIVAAQVSLMSAF
ncbi:oxalurate catabolism protein HpxZ [Pantoea sp. Nvir]|uniref:oxalurate catabolism protein HpxZ n=1 Tax=Pantoea sp. Nvir TaxID=2576760 RepID=UPI001356CD51|nr:oxalurate catabolism protein HpxZ [Pantoea sp. Nvir]MXP66962.1 oxalurate catabolism protein HpxZ [Pantoea sp. Nvir]CAJ0992502.1 hypothetical protein NVIRPANT_00677 [Pantoea sp. Nvir]